MPTNLIMFSARFIMIHEILAMHFNCLSYEERLIDIFLNSIVDKEREIPIVKLDIN